MASPRMPVFAERRMKAVQAGKIEGGNMAGCVWRKILPIFHGAVQLARMDEGSDLFAAPVDDVFARNAFQCQ